MANSTRGYGTWQKGIASIQPRYQLKNLLQGGAARCSNGISFRDYNLELWGAGNRSASNEVAAYDGKETHHKNHFSISYTYDIVFQPNSFSIDTIIHGDLTLKVDPPINIQHEYSPEDPKLLIADEPVFGMHLLGASNAELRDAAEDEIVFLWKEFVERTDETLSESALKLRSTLKSRIKRLS